MTLVGASWRPVAASTNGTPACERRYTLRAGTYRYVTEYAGRLEISGVEKRICHEAAWPRACLGAALPNRNPDNEASVAPPLRWAVALASTVLPYRLWGLDLALSRVNVAPGCSAS